MDPNLVLNLFLKFKKEFRKDNKNPYSDLNQVQRFINVFNEVKFLLKKNFKNNHFSYMILNIHLSLKLGKAVYSINKNYDDENHRIRFHTPFEMKFYWITKKITYGCDYYLMNVNSEYTPILHFKDIKLLPILNATQAILYTHNIALYTNYTRNIENKLANSFNNLYKSINK